MSKPGDKVTAASHVEHLTKATKHRAGIRHHAHKLAAQHYEQPPPPAEPPA